MSLFLSSRLKPLRSQAQGQSPKLHFTAQTLTISEVFQVILIFIVRQLLSVIGVAKDIVPVSLPDDNIINSDGRSSSTNDIKGIDVPSNVGVKTKHDAAVTKNKDDNVDSGDSHDRSNNNSIYNLPDLHLTMPFLLSGSDITEYAAAIGLNLQSNVTVNANSKSSPNEHGNDDDSSYTSTNAQAQILITAPQLSLLLSALSEPAMLLLLAHRECPVRPLGAVNMRNRFELLRSDLAREIVGTLLGIGSWVDGGALKLEGLSDAVVDDTGVAKGMELRAQLCKRGRRVKRGLEVDLSVEVVRFGGQKRNRHEDVVSGVDVRPGKSVEGGEGESQGEDERTVKDVVIFRQTFTMLQFMRSRGQPRPLPSASAARSSSSSSPSLSHRQRDQQSDTAIEDKSDINTIPNTEPSSIGTTASTNPRPTTTTSHLKARSRTPNLTPSPSPSTSSISTDISTSPNTNPEAQATNPQSKPSTPTTKSETTSLPASSSSSSPASATFSVLPSAPLTWCRLTKDYNPIHTSTLAAHLFGFKGRLAHGNHAFALGVARLQVTSPCIQDLGLEGLGPGLLKVGASDNNGGRADARTGTGTGTATRTDIGAEMRRRTRTGLEAGNRARARSVTAIGTVPGTVPVVIEVQFRRPMVLPAILRIDVENSERGSGHNKASDGRMSRIKSGGDDRNETENDSNRRISFKIVDGKRDDKIYVTASMFVGG